MGLTDFMTQVAQGKGAEAISKESKRVSGNVEREVDRVGQSVGREADKVVKGVEDAAAYVRREGQRATDTLGKKVTDISNTASGLGKKFSGEIHSIANKVETGADIASAVMGGAAAVAGATGVGAPIAAGLGAGAALIGGVGAMAGQVNRGLDRAENMTKMVSQSVGAGLQQGANTLNRGLSVAELRSGSMRTGIERVKNDAKSYKKQMGGTRGL